MKAQEKVGAAFGWKFFERVCVQGTNFLVTLLLARILSPADYGTVSIIMIFVTLANTFVQGGFNTALIQKKTMIIARYSFFQAVLHCFCIGFCLLLHLQLPDSITPLRSANCCGQYLLCSFLERSTRYKSPILLESCDSRCSPYPAFALQS